MTKLKIHIYILLTISLYILSACKSTKYVPKGYFLLKKNNVYLNKNQKHISGSNVKEVLKPKENTKFLGVKFRLALYNSVDSIKVAKSIKKKISKNKKRNKKILKRVSRINDKRITKSLKKGKQKYKPKKAHLRDTLGKKPTFLSWWKYKLGQPPSIYDSNAVKKSNKQIVLYLKKQGFYYSKVKDSIRIDTNKRKAIVNYYIETGKPYIIDSIIIDTKNRGLKYQTKKFLSKKGLLKKGMLLNSEVLDKERTNISNYLKNEAYYGFSPSLVFYKIDTNKTNMTATLKVLFKKRKVQNKELGDSVYSISHKTYKINKVYFYISDTLNLKGQYSKLVREKIGTNNLIDNNGYFYTFDTLVTPKATFLYNGKLLIKHHLIELQNFLEPNVKKGDNFYYRERYVSRSYQKLMDLGVFSSIKPILKQVGLTNKLDVYYYIIPAKKQRFSFEPRGTHSNGFLGFSASINYKNKNLFRGAQSLLISFSGGFESQPPIFKSTQDNSETSSERTFNSFDLGPKITLSLPGLFPFPARMLSRRQTPRTSISILYNFQSRVDFKRHLTQFDYTWFWKTGKKQTFRGSLLNPIKFSIINPSTEFQSKLDNLNDLFLRNAYNSQFTWEDIKISHVFDNQKENLNQGKSEYLYNRFTLNNAGGMASLITINQSLDSNGQKKILAIPYAQFLKLENEIKFHHKLGKKQDLNYRLNLGIGIPYGNSKKTMPYDYSFFGGGSNDNRGFLARTLGPGSYKYYLDTNRTHTQIGDIKIAFNIEYRFSISELFKLALFVDAGNIWTLRKDANRIGAKFSKNFYKEIAISSGIGIRLDFNFFVFRLDLGVPLNIPSLPDGEQWIWNKNKPKWHNELQDTYGVNWENYKKNLFIPRINIGIGYPF